MEYSLTAGTKRTEEPSKRGVAICSAGSVAVFWILFGNLLYALLTRFILSREEMFGILVWGMSDILPVMRREMRVVFRLRPSALARLAEGGA